MGCETSISPKLHARQAAASLQAHRIEPALGVVFLPLHIDVKRFVSIRPVGETGMAWACHDAASIPNAAS